MQPVRSPTGKRLFPEITDYHSPVVWGMVNYSEFRVWGGGEMNGESKGGAVFTSLAAGSYS